MVLAHRIRCTLRAPAGALRRLHTPAAPWCCRSTCRNATRLQRKACVERPQGETPVPTRCRKQKRAQPARARMRLRAATHVQPLPSPAPPPQRAAAEKALKAYQDHPDAWSRVDGILEQAKTQQTKFFALQVRVALLPARGSAPPVEQPQALHRVRSAPVAELGGGSCSCSRVATSAGTPCSAAHSGHHAAAAPPPPGRASERPPTPRRRPLTFATPLPPPPTPCPQILESVIKFRWGALPVEQREGIKNYVSNLIIKYATNEQLFRCGAGTHSRLAAAVVAAPGRVRRGARAGGRAGSVELAAGRGRRGLPAGGVRACVRLPSHPHTPHRRTQAPACCPPRVRVAPPGLRACSWASSTWCWSRSSSRTGPTGAVF